jgi:Asp-tRNA(Asn)/Glu-tRNA(Gln) amidotransferase A subunit family amidase
MEPVFASLRLIDGLPFPLVRLAPGREAELSANIRDRLEANEPGTTAQLQQVAALRDLGRAKIVSFMERCPILIMPVASVPAYRPDPDRYDRPADFDVDGNLIPRLKALSCTAAVVPFGTSRDGLPVGVQIVGRPFADAEVLAVASILSSARIAR